ncbi:MAG: NADH-quinone oxidoreductase subunit C [Elusimicrobiota bacterium]|jgi:NADH:ubiquinone oxidoreductase subunit C|nr:NADH-quinone oxidoreductase subunit C [Elusimicrobiota bacterium]
MPKDFEHLLQNIEVKAPRRVWAAPKAPVYDCIGELKAKFNFDHLCTITGLENGENFEILYHLSRQNGTLLTLRDTIKIEGAKTKSITPLFQSAIWYEKEINDLLGVEFEGLPQAARYPLPDEWPQGDHPLRKNWQPADHCGVTPKTEAE